MTKVSDFHVDPHAQEAALLSHHDRARRALEHDDHVVAALPAYQRVGVLQRAEDGQVGTGEIGGDGDPIGRQAYLDRFRALRLGRLLRNR